MNSKISYSDDCEKMIVNKAKILPTVYNKNGSVKIDYGYFARIKNPFNPEATIILVHGIHTFGVLGSVHAFSYEAAAKTNVEKILNQIGLNPYFESWFPVEVINGRVLTPKIRKVRSMSREKGAGGVNGGYI